MPDAFPWGTRWPPPKGSGNFNDESRHTNIPQNGKEWLEGYDDGFPATAPVMSFEPNKQGLFDLGGNVWEWCADWYTAERKDCVSRGNSWRGFGRAAVLSSFRDHPLPTVRSHDHGFRVVVDLIASP